MNVIVALRDVQTRAELFDACNLEDSRDAAVWDTAAHEGGHAVAAFARGLSVETASLEYRAGKIKGGAVVVAECSDARDMLAFALGGLAAELEINHNYDLTIHSAPMGGDRDQINDAAFRLWGERGISTPRYNEAMREVRSIIRANRTSVLAIGLALCRCRALDGAGVRHAFEVGKLLR